jgi:hypothetical protein
MGCAVCAAALTASPHTFGVWSAALSGGGSTAEGFRCGEAEQRVFCCSASLLRDRVQCMKHAYRKLGGGGVVKR